MDYVCELCGERIKGDALVFIRHSEEHIISLIKKDHPDWIETGGICRKCVEYYRKQLKG